MRHAIVDMRTLYYSPVTITRSQKNGEKIPTYSQPTAFQASVAPASGSLDAAAYGQRLPYIKRLYGASVALTEGDGVWLNANPEDQPDYIVADKEEHPREIIYIIEKRGVFGG